jgi:hypothetical protein
MDWSDVPKLLGCALVIISVPAITFALVTGRLWVGLFPSVETFAPEKIRRRDDPRRYDRHMVSELAVLAIGIVLIAI